jgi:hypothetical protein
LTWFEKLTFRKLTMTVRSHFDIEEALMVNGGYGDYPWRFHGELPPEWFSPRPLEEWPLLTFGAIVKPAFRGAAWIDNHPEAKVLHVDPATGMVTIRWEDLSEEEWHPELLWCVETPEA